MELTHCTLKDLDRLSAFYYEVVEHLEHTTNYPLWSHDYPGRESIRACIEAGDQFLCQDEHGTVLAAVVLNENPGGDYASGDWSRELSAGEYLIIHTFATSPAHAGQGIGKQALRACIDYAQSHSYKAIRLDVVPGNAPATHLYTKEGFQYAGTKDLKRDIPEIPVFELYERIL